MSSSETKMDEMIAVGYVKGYEQGSPGMLVPKKCDEQEQTDEKQREADCGTGQPAEADNGTGQAAEADNETGQPAEADNGTEQLAGADNESGQPAEADNETGQSAEEKKPSIPLLMALERPMIHIEEYNWPEEDEEFDGRNVVVIGINGSEEAEYAFKWYMTTLHRKKDLVVVVYALEVGLSRLGLLGIEDWNKETQRILDTKTALHDLYRRRFFDPKVGLKMNGAIVSRKGESGQLIVKEAKERRAAYIIIGKRIQDANLHQVVTNSTTDYVLCNANCPVLVCKMDPNRRRKQRRTRLPRT